MHFIAAIQDWFGWATLEGTLAVLRWIFVASCLLLGFAGCVLPILPGTTLIYLGILAHYFLGGMEEESRLTWQSLAGTGVLWALSVGADWLSGAIGAKWFGASRWGVAGAILGGIIGTIFFSLPGLILGPVIGVFAAEMVMARKRWKPAASSTAGSVLGGLAGMVVKLVLAGAMILWFIADVFLLN